MGILDKLDKKVEDLADSLPGKVEKKLEKDVKKEVKENVWGLVCIGLFKSKENATRCKALTKLPGIAKSWAAAAVSCTGLGAAGAAEVGTGGAASPIAIPAGLAAGASCVYNGAMFADKSYAFYETM